MNVSSYKLTVAGVERLLPVVAINDRVSIASFVMLGDTELVEKCAKALYDKLPVYQIDLLVCPEAKAIPITQALAQLMKVNYVVVRKSVKGYMKDPIIRKVMSITTSDEQVLVLDRTDADKMKGRNVCIVDDVVSTGQSLASITGLLNQIDCKVVCKCAALLEDAGHSGENLIYLEKLPIFKND